MTTYPTKYSDLSKLAKKEKKQKEASFPFVAPSNNLGNIDSCGQIVSKLKQGSNIKFCPICDYPMIVRMMIMPCEHVMCYSCSKPDSEYCFICETKSEKVIRLSDTTELYECDVPDCFKFFPNLDKLNMHKFTFHNQIMEQTANPMMNKFSNQSMYPPYGGTMPNMQNMPMGAMPTMVNMPTMPGMMPMGMHPPIGGVPQPYSTML